MFVQSVQRSNFGTEDLSQILNYRANLSENSPWLVGYREYVYSAVVYQKYLMRLRELIIFEPWRENYHFSQPSLKFLIYDSTMYVFYLSFNV